MSIRFVVDSGSDITQQEAKEMGIRVLPLRTTFDGVEYLDGIDIDHNKFYEMLVENAELPKTSQVPPYEYEDAFDEILADGDEVFCLVVSSKLSGCYQSANIAADGRAGISIVDTENVALGMRILVEEALRMCDEGCSLAELTDQINALKKKLRVVALLDTLEYLKKGGRISAAVAVAGTLLSIKPVVTVEEGEVVMLGKARGSKKGNNMLTEFVEKKGPVDYSKPICLAYSGMSDHLLMKYLSDNIGLYQVEEKDLTIARIGSAIGTHVGPGAIAVSFFCE